MTATVKLRVSDVGKIYGAGSQNPVEALRDISFDVAENEICVLLGPSGCGKSTLLRLVAGLEDLTGGSISLDGETILGPGRERGMVFQSYTSFPWLTVEQNVEYGMRLNGVPKPERREQAAKFIDLVHLNKFRDAYPKQLSGGMKQRVAIARTLANDPAILLMDEPFGALDAETRWHMQELLLDIQSSSHTTILLVTHDIQEAIFLADKIVFLSNHPGRIRTVMTPEFKLGKNVNSKEALISLDGYFEFERGILAMMREEAVPED